MLRTLIAAVLFSFGPVGAAVSQPYPSRAITMVVPFAAGGATDVIARIVAEGMSRALGQPIVIENVAGAGGTTGSRRVQNAAPDGYTLLVGHMGTHSSAFSLYVTPAYDPRRDFSPIGVIASAPIVVFSRSTFPATSFPEFVQLLRTRDSTVAHSGVGSNAHLTCALLASLIGVQSRAIAYRGNGPLMNDIAGGHVDYSCDQIITVASAVSGGQAKAYAITGAQRSPLLPAIPTFAEVGLSAFDADAWTALFAPRSVPQPILDRLNLAYQTALGDLDVQRRLTALGAVVPPTDQRGHRHLSQLVEREVDRWARVIEGAGIPKQ